MSRLTTRTRRGYAALRKQFTTPALILSIVALVLALAGGAYAAGGGLSGKQKKEVKRSPRSSPANPAPLGPTVPTGEALTGLPVKVKPAPRPNGKSVAIGGCRWQLPMTERHQRRIEGPAQKIRLQRQKRRNRLHRNPPHRQDRDRFRGRTTSDRPSITQISTTASASIFRSTST